MPRTSTRSGLPTWVDTTVIGLVAFTLGELTAGRFQTVDETQWMRRSVDFWDAIAGGNPSHATASVGDLATMPGITTMWVGTISRAIWAVGRGLGMWRDTGGDAFGENHASITAAQLTVATVVALLIVVVMILVRAWIGRVASVVTGLFLATEPFLVAHRSVLHTDELMALFGLISMVATALTLGVPRRTRFMYARGMSLVAGAGFGLAVLTKISALVYAPSVALIAAVAVVRATSLKDWSSTRAELSRAAKWFVGSAVSVVVLLYPALLVDPVTQISAIWRSAGLGSTGHHQYFRGESTTAPSAMYYVLAVPLRTSPWLFLAGAAALVAGLWSRSLRPLLTMAALMTVPTLLVLTLAAKKFDRYALIVPLVLAVLIGAAAQEATVRLRAQFRGLERTIAAAALGLVLVINSAAVAPWGLAYFNPLLGGSEHGERTLLVGWGEGLEEAGRLIARRERGRCERVTIYSEYPIASAFPCGTTVSAPQSAGDTDYLIVYVNNRQRSVAADLEQRIRARTLVERISIRGIVYVDLYQ